MRWPLMLKRTHEADLKAAVTIMQSFVDREYARAVKEGNARVHAFMRDANARVFTHPRPEIAVRAVFQQADREFRPAPLSVAERLNGPANLEEAIDATAGS